MAFCRSEVTQDQARQQCRPWDRGLHYPRVIYQSYHLVIPPSYSRGASRISRANWVWVFITFQRSMLFVESLVSWIQALSQGDVNVIGIPHDVQAVVQHDMT